MKRDTLGTLRARIAEAEKIYTGLLAEGRAEVQLAQARAIYAEQSARDSSADADRLRRAELKARRRAEAAEAALREIGSCPDGVSKTWPEIDAIVRRVVVEGQANAK